MAELDRVIVAYRMQRDELEIKERELRELLRDRTGAASKGLRSNLSDRSVREELENCEPERGRLDHAISVLDIEREGLLRYLKNEQLVLDIFSRRPRQPMQDSKKQRSLREHPNLALAIYQKIWAADAVLVIATTGSVFKYWMEFEIDTAAYAGKPILGLSGDPSRKNLPPEYRSSGIAEITWAAQIIRQEIESRLIQVGRSN